MNYRQLIEHLEASSPTSRVEVEDIADLVRARHKGVGELTFRWMENIPGARPGMFIWQDGDRSSPYEEQFNHAHIFINEMYREDREKRRLVGAKELMHVFDTPDQQANDEDRYRTLIQQIEALPMNEDQSPQYQADREALWKARIALVPPSLRQIYLEGWSNGTLQAAELSARFWLPDNEISAIMGKYYDIYLDRFMSDNRYAPHLGYAGEDYCIEKENGLKAGA